MKPQPERRRHPPSSPKPPDRTKPIFQRSCANSLHRRSYSNLASDHYGPAHRNPRCGLDPHHHRPPRNFDIALAKRWNLLGAPRQIGRRENGYKFILLGHYLRSDRCAFARKSARDQMEHAELALFNAKSKPIRSGLSACRKKSFSNFAAASARCHAVKTLFKERSGMAFFAWVHLSRSSDASNSTMY